MRSSNGARRRFVRHMIRRRCAVRRDADEIRPQHVKSKSIGQSGNKNAKKRPKFAHSLSRGHERPSRQQCNCRATVDDVTSRKHPSSRAQSAFCKFTLSTPFLETGGCGLARIRIAKKTQPIDTVETPRRRTRDLTAFGLLLTLVPFGKLAQAKAVF